VVNVLDFCTGQLFDWFIASDTAFALVERLPSTVTGNVSNPACREATEVGIDKMYTQVIREVPVPGRLRPFGCRLSSRLVRDGPRCQRFRTYLRAFC
jgi:hypothetical protein